MRASPWAMLLPPSLLSLHSALRAKGPVKGLAALALAADLLRTTEAGASDALHVLGTLGICDTGSIVFAWPLPCPGDAAFSPDPDGFTRRFEKRTGALIGAQVTGLWDDFSRAGWDALLEEGGA